jgi:tetratricopeptide (TPR) repeat protein
MKAKIDWYREVLELEPGSKVFFPLARLLAGYGQVQDALSALRLGLERHPEFMEARLYLIDLLYQQGQITQCEAQVGQLTRLFSQYPGFWEAWGACAADAEQGRDLSLTLRFLAALFQYPDLDLGQVLERGLHSLAGTPATLSPATDAGRGTNNKTQPVASALFNAAARAPAGAGSSPAAMRAEEADDPEEPFNLRTKSMADVLAGQSDIGGALEIYQELALRAESPEERREIHACMARLASKAEPVAGAPPPPPPAVAPPPGKQRMQHLLESLAQRLEARASG